MIYYLIVSILLNFVLIVAYYWYHMKWEICTKLYQIAIHENYYEIRSDGEYQLKFVKISGNCERDDVFSSNFIYDENEVEK